MIQNIVSQCRRNCAIKFIDVDVALWMVRRGVEVFRTNYSGNSVKNRAIY